MPSLDDDLDWLYRRGQYGSRGESPRPVPVPEALPSSTVDKVGTTPEAVQPLKKWTPSGPPRVVDDHAGRTQPRGASRTPGPGPVPPVPATAAAPSGRRRFRIVRWVLLLAVLVLSVVAYLVIVPMMAWSGVQHVDYVPTTGERPAQQPGTLLLLAGSDSRDGLSSQQMHDLGTGSEGGNVADTIMLLYLPPSGRPALISMPRDSYVAIPGKSKNKINAAYGIGGPKLLTATIEQNTGLRVDGYLGIGFGGFVSIIDALGGIEQCPTSDIHDDFAHLDLKKGCQNMDGVTALKFVRYRHADPLGDLGRANRQRAMVAAVAKKAMGPMTFVNPSTYFSLNKAGASAMKLGRGTELTDVAPAAMAFLAISKGDGLTLTVPVSNPDYRTPNAGSAVLWDAERAKTMFGMIARGDTSQLDQFKK